MKEIINHFYNGILRFFPVKRYMNVKISHSGTFPVVGFLDEEKKKELESKIGFEIKKIEYFEQALIHRSYLQVIDKPGIFSNERLEFLGDAVLGMVVAEYLFSLHSQVLEGELTKMRSWLVNRKSLALCAKKLELDKFLMLSYSAEKSLKSGSDSIMADAMESIIAAIYLDSGLESAHDFIINSLIPILMEKKVMSDKNYKSLLLEKVQAKGKESPSYKVIDEEGPDHDKVFTVSVIVEDQIYGQGTGKSKKQAEQTAAMNALDNYFSEKAE